MSFAKGAADVAQRATVLGFVSFFGLQVYQIGKDVVENKVENQYQHTDMFNKLKAKVEEEAQLQEGIDKIPDRYDRDDRSYLKRVPDLQKPTKN